jgi:methionyl-tRNA synthetase
VSDCKCIDARTIARIQSRMKQAEAYIKFKETDTDRTTKGEVFIRAQKEVWLEIGRILRSCDHANLEGDECVDCGENYAPEIERGRANARF